MMCNPEMKPEVSRSISGTAYLARKGLVAVVVSLIAVGVMAHFDIMDDKLSRELARIYAPIGITICGFFLTALSIIVGSSSEFIKNIKRERKTAFKSMVSTFFLTITCNLLLVVVSLFSLILPSVGSHRFIQLVVWFAPSFLLIMAIYFISLTIHGFYIVLQKIVEAP
jgi:hypothetical protein